MVMRMEFRRWSAFARLATSALFAATCQAFVEMPFGDTHYGPDGPWQAIDVDIRYTGGSEYTTVSCYPGSMYGTIAALYVPTQQVCTDSDVTNYDGCVAGGAIDPLVSYNGSSWYTYYNSEVDYYFYLNGSTAYTDLQLPNNIDFGQALTDVLRVGEMRYPSGITLPIEVGYFGLGGSPLPWWENPPLALYQSELTTSNFYGLHIGSAKLGYKGSLIFGGYDRGRVIGPVITYDAHTNLNIIDVVIGTEAGDSPFDGFENQDNLLNVPADSGYSEYLPVLLKPEYPYIFMNPETIDNIVQHLPITHDSSSGYYLWNTNDPSYEKIVNGAGYLGFVFPAQSGNTAQTTIKVPFKMLNLTLEATVSGLDSDKAYIPIMGTNVGKDTDYRGFLLGRGFLQSAFMGANWGRNISFLAQAPGPGADSQGLGYSPVDVADGDTTLSNVRTGDSLLAQSWSNHWTVLGTSNDGSNGGDSGGLSSGAIAGIVVGVVGGLALIGGIVAFVLIRKKRKARAASINQQGYAPPGQEHAPGTPGLGPQMQHYPSGSPAPAYGQAQPYYSDKPAHHEMHADNPNRQEMDGSYYAAKQYKPDQPAQPTERYEMSANISDFSELPGHDPQELPANPRTQ